jgi:hypothetical protein
MCLSDDLVHLLFALVVHGKLCLDLAQSISVKRMVCLESTQQLDGHLEAVGVLQLVNMLHKLRQLGRGRLVVHRAELRSSHEAHEGPDEGSEYFASDHYIIAISRTMVQN